MPPNILPNLQIEQYEIPDFVEVALSAFEVHGAFDDEVLRPLGHCPAGFNPVNGVLRDTIKSATIHYNTRGAMNVLLTQMVSVRPYNLRLVEYMWRWHVPYSPPGAIAEVRSKSVELQRMIDAKRGFTSFSKLTSLANAICQISYADNNNVHYGTGFLIGNSTVLTNWHVAEHINASNHSAVQLRFDYRDDAPDQGHIHGLAKNTEWLIDHSPYTCDDQARDTAADRLRARRPDLCLDYAILRTEGAPGEDQLGISRQGRGFITLPNIPTTSSDYDRGAGLFILQHPYDTAARMPLPLQLDWDKPSVIGMNANETRVLYNVNTAEGSSGSPCFNTNLELIAVHHAGGGPSPFNQGIPIGPIRRLIERRGKTGEIR